MDLAYVSFQRILTMLILMSVGILCSKIGFIDQDMNKKLVNLLLMLVSPLLIFSSYLRSFSPELLHGLLLAFILSIISHMIKMTVAHFLFRNKDRQDSAIEKFASVYPNANSMGMPLIFGIFGSEGVFYLTAYITISQLSMWTYGVMIMSKEKRFSMNKKALLSPPLLAVYFGFLFFVLQIPVPEMITEPIQLIGGMNAPLAMIIAGVSISQADVGKIMKNVQVYQLCFVRLLLIPIIVITLFNFFDIPTVVKGTIIVATACPVAANCIFFAYRHRQNHLYASKLFAASTVLSMGTIPLLMLFI